MKKKYEIWHKLFQTENANTNSYNKKKTLSREEELPIFMSILFGLAGLALLILLIVFATIGDTSQNLISLGVMSGICFLMCIIYLFIPRNKKQKPKLDLKTEDPSNDKSHDH